MTELAITGALQQIAADGGGTVESYPHDLTDQRKKMSSSFLYNGTRRLYERLGFTYDRSKGLKNCVMVTTVAPASAVGAQGTGGRSSRAPPLHFPYVTLHNVHYRRYLRRGSEALPGIARSHISSELLHTAALSSAHALGVTDRDPCQFVIPVAPCEAPSPGNATRTPDHRRTVRSWMCAQAPGRAADI